MLFRDVWGAQIPFQEVLGCLGHSLKKCGLLCNQPTCTAPAFGCQAKSFKSEHFNYPGLAGSLGKVMEAHSLKKKVPNVPNQSPFNLPGQMFKDKTVCEDSSKKMSETRGMLIASVPRSRQRNLRLKDQRRSLKYIAFKYVCIYIFIYMLYIPKSVLLILLMLQSHVENHHLWEGDHRYPWSCSRKYMGIVQIAGQHTKPLSAYLKCCSSSVLGLFFIWRGPPF